MRLARRSDAGESILKSQMFNFEKRLRLDGMVRACANHRVLFRNFPPLPRSFPGHP
jgi:hypothetical protein